MIIFCIIFIIILLYVWYLCALIFIACHLWEYDCSAYTKLGYWICKIATLGTKE